MVTQDSYVFAFANIYANNIADVNRKLKENIAKRGEHNKFYSK